MFQKRDQRFSLKRLYNAFLFSLLCKFTFSLCTSTISSTCHSKDWGIVYKSLWNLIEFLPNYQRATSFFLKCQKWKTYTQRKRKFETNGRSAQPEKNSQPIVSRKSFKIIKSSKPGCFTVYFVVLFYFKFYKSFKWYTG